MTPLLAANLRENFPVALGLSVLVVAALVAIFLGIDRLWFRRRR